MELYSDITAKPSPLVHGQAGTVYANFYNTNSYTYVGIYQADLYDLRGNWVQTIASYYENAGLPSGHDYSSPIPFTSSDITANPGTYILAINEKEPSDPYFYLAGGEYYTNPVYINVVSAALQPDKYEPNNTLATAYTLPITWSNNAANPNTVGSNINVATDIDYYKINLAAGYDYTITARVDNSKSSANGKLIPVMLCGHII